MKKFFHFIGLCLTIFLITNMVNAQSPNAIPYQAVARNAFGNLIQNQNVNLRFTIHNATVAGTIVYQETKLTQTNALGLFTVNIGTGNVVAGAFSNIIWGTDAKFLQVEIDISGNTNFIDMGTQQLMSVPYALYANNGLPAGSAPGNMLYWDGSQWLNVPPGTTGQTLHLCYGVPTWGPCLPSVTTNAIGTISYNYADCGGNVTNDGASPVTSRGICWSSSHNPTLADFSSTNGAGTGTGTFLVFASNLIPGTTYYLRAFATNAIGTAYGNEQTFTTLSAVVPSLYTSGAFSISYTVANVSGSVTSDGGLPVTAHGICWSTSPNPTLANNYMPDFTTNTFNYYVSLFGLNQGTTYYAKAYATNSLGTGYGNEITFSTLGFSIPILSTTSMSSIASTSAVSGGNITSGGGSNITTRGVCYSTSPNPTTADNIVVAGGGTGSFTCTLNGLTSNVTYYVRAYATNSTGTAYGSQVIFTSSPYALGQSFGGGIIFYIDGTNGQHGLIAATADGPNSGNTFWGTIFPPVVATGTAIGTGLSNTLALLNAMGSIYPCGQCQSYSGGGFNDWFLPSQNECALMIQNKAYIGNINNNGPYWTSTQVSGSVTVAISTSGSPFSVQHANVSIYYYRAVRAF